VADGDLRAMVVGHERRLEALEAKVS
jgi:hypothetical protein